MNTRSSAKDTLFNFENSNLFMEDYQPISGLIHMKKMRTKKTFSVKKFNDAIYMGEMRGEELLGGEDSEIREGLGIMVYK